MLTFEQALLYAIPAFSALIGLEYVYGLWKKRNTYANLSDAISSLLSGLTFTISNTLGFTFIAVSFGFLHEYLALAELSSSQWWVWLVAFVFIDFVGYWAHRWAHENSFLWSMHIIHHSSEHFNLAVALRQNAFKWLGYRSFMMLPMALIGVPPEVIAVLFPVQYFLQYWYHTEHIGKLGRLEYVIVTPSQHRVHHAINDVYIDKNYSNVFCWDRLFGTFQEELEGEPCVYGCLGAVQTWDPIKIELRHMGRLCRDALFTKNWSDKLKVFTSRTGWRPEDAKAKWPRVRVDVSNFQRYHGGVPKWLEWWGFTELLFIAASAMYLFANMPLFVGNTLLLASYVLAALFGINGLARLLENKAGWVGSSARLGIFVLTLINSGDLFGLPSVVTVLVLLYCAAGFAVRFLYQSKAMPQPFQVKNAAM